MKRLLLLLGVIAAPALATPPIVYSPMTVSIGAAAAPLATAPVFTAPSMTVPENVGSFDFPISKSTKSKSYSKIRVQSVDGSAKAGVDYKSFDTELTFGNNTLKLTVPVAIIDNSAFSADKTFGVRIVPERNAQVAGGYQPTTITISENDLPPPPPPPTADPLKGAPEIADNFDAAKGLMPAEWQINGVPQIAPPSKEDVGAFRFFCSPGQLLRDDPMVYPGQPGASHLHQFVGNTGTNGNSTYASLRTTGGTTCGAANTPINRSAYWMPAMLDGAGSVVKPDYTLIYYKREPASSPACTDPVKRRGICVDLPNGIRFLFGYDMKTMSHSLTDMNNAEYWNIAFFCWGSEDKTVGDGGATGRYHSIKEVADAGCPAGAQLIITGFAPNCWDGNLDAADHRSNVVYAAKLDAGLGIRCDDAHPYLIPDMQFQWHFTTDANFGKWHLDSDEQMAKAMGTTVVAGTTMHMDYFEAWSPLKAIWQKTCINGHLTCASGDMGDTTEIIGAGMPFPGGFPKHQLVPVP